MPEAVIVAMARSPIGRATKGSLVDVRPDELAAQVISALLASVPQLDPAEIEDLMLGCGRPGGESGYNMARVVAVMLGLDHLPGITLTRYCASSLQTTRMAAHAIWSGEGNAFVSAGVETVSRYPRGSSDSIPGTRNPRFETRQASERREAWVDPRVGGEMPDVYMAMGITAENVAQLHGISRREQDEFAVRSHQLAEAAVQSGFWSLDLTPVTTPQGDVVSRDDGPRKNVTLDGVAALAPAFLPEGTVTAGNCCPLNDGAAALVIMSDSRARELGLPALARIVSTGVAALSPEIMGMGPVEASRTALRRAGMSIHDVDLVELNEAFAAQVIPCANELGIDLDVLNIRGGAIAMGHPFGMTGARMTGTLVRALQDRDQSVGLATMCVAGGQGMAMVLERLA